MSNEEKIAAEVMVVDLEELPRKWGWLLRSVFLCW